MLDFKSTHDKDGKIHYCNDLGQTLTTLPYSGLLSWCRSEHLETWLDSFDEDFNPTTINHQKDYLGRFEDYVLDRYIELNWFEITEKYYNSVKPTEHKSKTTYAYSKEANR